MPLVDALVFSFPLLLSLSSFFPELDGWIGSLERELETSKVAIGQSTEVLAKYLEERCALEGELDQIRNIA